MQVFNVCTLTVKAIWNRKSTKMAAMCYKISINSNINTNGLLSPPPNKLHSHLLLSNQKFCGRRTLASPPFSLIRSKKCWHGSLRVSNSSQSSASNSFDVVIVGAGIIGLTIARHLLLASDLSVALVDAAVPCSGATGAGKSVLKILYIGMKWAKYCKMDIEDLYADPTRFGMEK